LDGGECNQDSQTTTSGRRFRMGSCNGCLGPADANACRCREYFPPTSTTTTTLRTGHYRCSGGRCILVDGVGADECGRNKDCFHFRCKNRACILDRSPGNDTCEDNVDCISVWPDREE
jgi:hypothetical protein